MHTLSLQDKFQLHGLDYSKYNNGIYNARIQLSSKNITSLTFLHDLGIKHVTDSVDLTNNKLESLQFCPTIGGWLYLAMNHLRSLQYCPDIRYSLNVDTNDLSDLKYFPKVDGNFYCRTNHIVDVPFNFAHPLDRFICDQRVTNGRNYKRIVAFNSF